MRRTLPLSESVRRSLNGTHGSPPGLAHIRRFSGSRTASWLSSNARTFRRLCDLTMVLPFLECELPRDVAVNSPDLTLLSHRAQFRVLQSSGVVPIHQGGGSRGRPSTLSKRSAIVKCFADPFQNNPTMKWHFSYLIFAKFLIDSSY